MLEEMPLFDSPAAAGSLRTSRMSDRSEPDSNPRRAKRHA
jgi:hypothetical protein